jgi:ATP-dependent DNA helicase RecG
MTADEVRRLIAAGESLTVEFKSDATRLPDAEWIETVVCMANHQGGTLIVGVEDDGTVTGLHSYHQTSPMAVAAFIASRTVPPLTVEVHFVNLSEGMVAVLSIPAARQPMATSDGKLLIRYSDTHGKPGCRPLHPHELTGWRADRGMADFSSLAVPEASWADFDLIEFARLRRLVEENRGDKALLELADEEIARALGLVSPEFATLTPSLAGLLLVGKESALHKYLPAHEAAFQVLRGTDVAVNEFHRWPLLRVYEWLMQAIEVRNEEQELMVNGFRVGVPRYDRYGVREAINNALIHRDYARLGAVHVQLHDDHVVVSNPGGFVTGLNVNNLLTVSPRPRNPRLADAFKRIGLVERTGRGVNTIYLGQLKNGRRPPAYDRTTETGVTVALDSRPVDLRIVKSIIAANKRLGRALTAPELLVLWEARTVGEATVEATAQLIQREPSLARDLLRQMEQDKLIIRVANGDSYRLDSSWYANANHTAVAEPLSLTQIEHQLLAYVQRQGRIQRSEVEAMSGWSRDQAYRWLKRMVAEGKLKQSGRGRAVYYRPAAIE